MVCFDLLAAFKFDEVVYLDSSSAFEFGEVVYFDLLAGFEIGELICLDIMTKESCADSPCRQNRGEFDL